ncbi:MAG: hypothetical protein AAF633_22875 [Chloroflexota bacterium]
MITFVDVKINGQDGPVSLNIGETFEASYTAITNPSTCFSPNNRNQSTWPVNRFESIEASYQIVAEEEGTFIFDVSCYVANGSLSNFDQVEVRVVERGCGGLNQESEAGVISGSRFQRGSGLNASGNGYIYVPDSGTSQIQHNSAAGNNDYVTYCFDVPEAGRYRIKGWTAYQGNSARTHSDSFFEQVNNSPSSGYLWQTDGTNKSGFVTDFVHDRGKNDPQYVELSQGQQEIKIFLREDGTVLDKLQLEKVGGSSNPTPMPTTGPDPTPAATPNPTSCGGLTQEAENGTLNGRFRVGNGLAASNGRYVYVPDSGSISLQRSSASGNGDYVSFCVDIPSSGRYRIKGWTAYQGGSARTHSDSFFVQVDGSPSSGYLWQTDGTNTSSIITDYVHDRGKTDPQYFNLSAGQHEVRFYLREDGTVLDKFQFEKVN